MLQLRIRFLCKSCGKPLRSKTEQEGKPFKCPFCGQVQSVPVGVTPTSSNAEHQAILRERERAEVAELGDNKILLNVNEEWKPKFVGNDQKHSEVEVYFKLVIRGIQRMTTECMRILENEKLTPEQRKRLIQSELDSNYQEVSRYRDQLQNKMDRRKAHIRQHVQEHAVRFDQELERMNHEMRSINLLVKLMFEEYRVGEHLIRDKAEELANQKESTANSAEKKSDTEVLRMRSV